MLLLSSPGSETLSRNVYGNGGLLDNAEVRVDFRNSIVGG